MTFLSDGLNWLHDKQEECFAEKAFYTQFDDTVEILASKGKTDQTLLAVNEVDLGSFMFDFIIKKENLPFEPMSGDEIRQGNAVYQVSNLVQSRCWDYTDSTCSVYRVHAQLIRNY